MKILLIGKDGQIGKSLCNILKKNHEIFSIGKKECNLQKEKEIVYSLKNSKADLVINAAAFTDLEKAEDNPKQAFLINSDAVGIISSITKEKDIPFIHYSTDFVFDGKKIGKYLEEDVANPINIYGKSKLSGEENSKINNKHIIIRTSRVYASFGNNFINKIFDLSERKNKLKIINDQIGTPTSADLIAKTTNNLVDFLFDNTEEDIYGTYHLVAEGSTSWYDYSKLIVEEIVNNNYKLKLSVNDIDAISSADYNSKVNRPKNSVLSTEKIKSILSLEIPRWEDDVRKTIKKIIKNKLK